MEYINFTEHEVLKAYKKLKHYFYYDNTSLFIRKKIADFEKAIDIAANGQDFEIVFRARMSELADRLNKKSIKYWQSYSRHI